MKQKVDIIFNYLRLLTGFSVPRGYIEAFFRAHTAPDSMVCVTDMLDELNIDYVAIEIDKAQFHDMPTPVIAFRDDKDFVLIEHTEKYARKFPEFINEWNGIIIVAEIHSSASINKDVYRNFSTAAIESGVLIFTGIIVLFIWPIFFAIRAQDVRLIVIEALALAGIGLGTIISVQTWGLTDIADKFCNAMGTGCEKTFRTNKAMLFSWLSLTDCVVVFFLAQLISTLLPFPNAKVLLLTLTLVAPIASITALLAIFYQAYRKQWCIFCLFIAAVVLLQHAILLPGSQLSALVKFNRSISFGLYLMASLISLGSWILIRRLMISSKQHTLTTERFSRFKKSEALLSPLLTSGSQVDTASFAHEVQIGNPDAPLQLDIACSPYCVPCAKAHEVIAELICLRQQKIGVRIYFNYQLNMSGNKGNKAIQHILQAIKEFTANRDTDAARKIKQDILHDWFKTMDLGEFDQSYPITTDNVDDALEHGAWCSRREITYTPTIFINGNRLMAPYNYYDLPEILPVLLNKFEINAVV
ncbi:MAG TPA: vitamin K epoxide reductase family protein [Chitinophaga sp.]|uniref:vitamin K epoxide reductase family protein n=1 Tax=Chitinophaga sp. TaxID=1869181 RepID=UPI002C6C77F5|nr:vitamin K epoxide reductase family protein [Chitinophaga sp.]HVI45221.1 vitamin K epoxide reductase family protein [Chitinophaga sp.]